MAVPPFDDASELIALIMESMDETKGSNRGVSGTTSELKPTAAMRDPVACGLISLDTSMRNSFDSSRSAGAMLPELSCTKMTSVTAEHPPAPDGPRSPWSPGAPIGPTVDRAWAAWEAIPLEMKGRTHSTL